VQTLRHPDVSGTPGGVAQVRECAAMLVAEAKRRGVAVVLVGHVTKDGQLAGPRVLEHLVDAVVEIEGDRHHALRLLRSVKNRYGPAGEVGCFEMSDDGMRPVADAGRLFVGDGTDGTPGVAVTLALEGRRPLACEVQALVAGNTVVSPRRVASGLDGQRLALLAAVLHQRCRVLVGDRDVFASTVGGVRLTEPATDLGLCLAIASGCSSKPVSPRTVVVGEVGLAGEVRLVAGMQRRLAEAARLGFEGAVLPAAYDGPSHGLRLVPVRDVAAALAAGLQQTGPTWRRAGSQTSSVE
jgi:DNA repair protein RadA/Sms